MQHSEDEIPFPYRLKVGHISANPVEVKLAADAEELKALADFWNVRSVDALSAILTVSRWKKDGVRVKGEVHAELTQSCVVTLEPVASVIDERFEQIFVPECSKLARIMTDASGEMVLDPEGPDLPEEFSGDEIDAGQAVCECVALAIDPYPRKEGVAFDAHIEDDAKEDKKQSPFAVLKDWKKDS